MTAPHPALLQLVALGETGPIQDEDGFLLSSQEHRMQAIVLSAYESGAVPLSSEAVMTLGMWDLAERRRHLMFWETVGDVGSRLEPLGIDFAVIKGIATEARWYEEIGQRVCTDLDVLLSPEAFESAVEVARRFDFVDQWATSIDWLVQRRLLQHVDLHLGSTHVDLHFDPFKLGIPTRQIDEVWASTETLVTGHGTIRVLRPELELVLLLLHMNKDRFAFLGTFLDIRRILDATTLDWQYLRAFVAFEGLEVPVWKSLAAVASVLSLDLDVPDPGGVRSATWDRLWGAKTMFEGYGGRERARLPQRFLSLHATHRGGDVWRELKRQVFPPRRLIEVAGMLEPEGSYLRYLALDRFKSQSSELLG